MTARKNPKMQTFPSGRPKFYTIIADLNNFLRDPNIIKNYKTRLKIIKKKKSKKHLKNESKKKKILESRSNHIATIQTI